VSYEIKRVRLDFNATLHEIWPGRLLTNENGSWRPIEPPLGEGWQLWETVTEGSPVTPVFAKRADLIDYLANNEEFGFDDANAQALVLKGSVPSGVLEVHADGQQKLYFSNQIAALSAPVEAPEPNDISDWLQHRREQPLIMSIHYDEQGIPVYAVIKQNDADNFWSFRYSRYKARLYRTRLSEAPSGATSLGWWTAGQPLPEHVTFIPCNLWENSDDAPDGSYWNGFLNSWLLNKHEPALKALNDDWIARGSPVDSDDE